MFDLEQIQGVNDCPIFVRGPKDAIGSVVYFALSGEESLLLDPINQPVAFLLKYPIKIFSFTLPGHELSQDSTMAMQWWAKELADGNNFIHEFISKVIQNLDFLIEERKIHPDFLAAAGLSRGAFVAAHLTARYSRIQSLLGFAPLTHLKALEEFFGYGESQLSERLNLEQCVSQLSDKSIRFYIGNRDLRVGTQACFKLVQALVEDAYQKGVRSPPIEMFITPSIGHKGHGTSAAIFQKGADWLKQKLFHER